MQMSVQNDCTYFIVQVLFLWERASDQAQVGTMECKNSIGDLRREHVQQRPQFWVEFGVYDHLSREHAVLAWVESSKHQHVVRRPIFPPRPITTAAAAIAAADGTSTSCCSCRIGVIAAAATVAAASMSHCSNLISTGAAGAAGGVVGVNADSVERQVVHLARLAVGRTSAGDVRLLESRRRDRARVSRRSSTARLSRQNTSVIEAVR